MNMDIYAQVLATGGVLFAQGYDLKKNRYM
jgi:hypothetical protein